MRRIVGLLGSAMFLLFLPVGCGIIKVTECGRDGQAAIQEIL